MHFKTKAKKSQSASAASGLVIAIAALLLLYILMVPPDVREDLLQGTSAKEKSQDSAYSFSYNKTLLTESPGRIDYLKFSEYEHPLPAVNLYSKTEARELDIGTNIYVKHGVFDKKEPVLSFSINPENIESPYLSFTTSPNRNNKGILSIYLNGKLIFSKDIGKTTPEPIAIQKESLKQMNELRAAVSGVGIRFWTTNEYELNNMKLVYNKIDKSTMESKNVFSVSKLEKYNLDRVKLIFFPECQVGNAGKLKIAINNRQIYSSVPDCGQFNVIEFSPSIISSGQNKIAFESENGRYLIDQINVKAFMKEMSYPVYYFDVDERFFKESTINSNDEEECGKIDGYCPVGCDADLDKDCCLEKTSYYWCDIQPSYQDDRCRPVTKEEDCSLCPSGYEGKNGNPPELCENKCGDDTDGSCPENCNKNYDKDCCFDNNEDNFWCNDAPLYGISQCKYGITEDECDSCPTGWRSESSRFKCNDNKIADDSEAELKPQYRIKLTLKFLNDNERKAATIYINGFRFSFDTKKDEYSRYIDSYIEPKSNALKIEPDRTTLEIRKLIISVEER